MSQEEPQDREPAGNGATGSSGTATTAQIDFLKRPGLGDVRPSDGVRRQSMRGFDEDYTDIVDYIVRCTHRIWDRGAMGLLYTHYAPNCRVHTAYGVTYGREEMLTQSIAALAAFPDRQTYADDVIWTGDDEAGFHTSHRVVHVARNNGHSAYGPPTGRRIRHLGIANCLVRENLIVEEWLVRDGLATVRQLGLDENRVVERLLAADERLGVRPSYGHPARTAGQTSPVEAWESDRPSGVEELVRRSQHEIWNLRRFDRIDAYYASNYLCSTSTDRRIYGTGDFQAYVVAFIAAFPDARMNVDHVYSVGDEREGYRVASRWTLLGTHDGPGVYGEPTGNPVNIMGITHHEVRDGRFVREWTVFDELALLKQLRGGGA